MTTKQQKQTRKVTLFNPTAAPVVYTDTGKILAGGERCEVDELDNAGRTVVEHGYLVNETSDASQEEEVKSGTDGSGAPETKGAP
jgi:hypothetical protein